MLLTYGSAFYDLKQKLQPLYDEREAAAIAHELLEYITGLGKVKRLAEKDTFFTVTQQAEFLKAAAKLRSGAPLQYVMGKAWFMGREFAVNEHVLIPRPETEELVQWVIEDHRGLPVPGMRILDVGTGSGCIPLSLKLALPAAAITSYDISSAALEVACQNATKLQADVNFVQLDFLAFEQYPYLGMFDVIISNPPYIPLSEKTNLHANVRDHEPGLALFVPDNDALVFYRAVATFGNSHLADAGHIYCELDAGHAMECKRLFQQAGYATVELRADIHGNLRMLKATKQAI